MWSFLTLILVPQIMSIVAQITPPSQDSMVSPTFNLLETPPALTTAVKTQATTEAMSTQMQDPCIPNQCQNGASCYPDDSNGFTCDCSFTEYTGVYCEIVDCEPIEIDNCPKNIHKLIPELKGDSNESPQESEISPPNAVFWTTPTTKGERTKLCRVSRSTPTRYPGSIFPVGLTPVTYNFTDASGKFALCSFVVNITEVSCPDNQFQCVSSGRCISQSLVCDFYPHCTDGSDETNCFTENEGLIGSRQCDEGAQSLFLSMQRSCSTEKDLPHVEVLEVPWKKREAIDEDLGRSRWKFYTDQIQTDVKVFLERVEIRIYDLYEVGSSFFRQFDMYDQSPAEFQITIRTSKSEHEVITYQPAYIDINGGINGGIPLQSPLELMPDEEVDITVAYTPDPLNSDTYPVVISYPCTDCITVSTRALFRLPCADLDMCLNNFYNWKEAGGPSCLWEELSNLYETFYENLCHSKPSILYVTPDQEGDPNSSVVLSCLAIGIPPPKVTWIDENEEAVDLFLSQHSDYSVPAASGRVPVGDEEKRYFCKYESPDASGISEAVVVKPLSPICMEANQNQTLIEDREACLNEAAVSGRLSRMSTSVLEMQVDTYELLNYAGNSLIRSVSIAGDTFRYLRKSGPPVTTVVLALFEYVGFPRRKRSVDETAVYRMLYEDVFVLDTNVVFNISLPLFITPDSEYGSSFGIGVSLDLKDWEFKRGVEIAADARLNITQCVQDLEFARYELGIDCPAMYGTWTSLVEDSRQYGCDSSSYTLYQKCIMDNHYEPILTSATPQPQSLLVGPSSDGRGLQCPIEHAARFEWRKLEKESEVIVQRVSGNVLLFQEFQAEDQGSYICLGYGSGMYEDVEVKSSPALVVIEGASTFIATIVFPEYGYSDDFGRDVERSSSPPEFNELEGWFRTAGSQISRQTDESQNMPPLFLLEDANLRATFPADINGSYGTGFETVLYFQKLSAPDTMISDVTLINMFTNVLTETKEDVIFEGLGPCELSSLNITNIGSCPGEQTSLPFMLTWEETQVGQVAESNEQCPGYSDKNGPRATRKCVGDLVYEPKWNDIVVNDCFEEETMEVNQVITIISQSIVTDENVTEVAMDLSEVTNDTTNVNATGLEAVAMVLENIVNVQSPTPEVTSSVVDTIDNVLNIDDDIFRDSVDQNTPTRILLSLEEQLTVLQNQGMNFSRSRPNIEVNAVQFPQSSVGSGIGFANLVLDNMISRAEVFVDPDDIPINDADTTIALPSEVITQFRNQVNSIAMVPATFILYQNSKLFQSKRLRQESTPDNTRVVGSRIISATIEGIQVNNLPPDQQIVSTYIHTKEENENTTLDNFQCVFWDYDLENGNGDWSTEGCMLVKAPESGRSVCHCDHLTSFAVLIDIHGQKYALLALDVLSIIGCFISITALVILLVTYLATKSLRSKTPKKILICLSATLLCLYIVFVAGIDRTSSSSGCAFVAVLLHYLTLSSVCWMGVEAVNLYLLIVKVFNADVSHFMLKACLAAWGGPLIPVLIVLAADYTQYVNEHHCFMKASYAFYFADLFLILIILVANIVVFIKILYKLTCGRNKTLVRSSDRDKKQSVTRALNSLAICAVLGLTWVFGFLTIFENRASSLLFQVLFCLFNSLQGLFIFVLFCVRPEEVRAVWKRWLGLSGKRKQGGFVSSSNDGRSHGTSNAYSRSTGISNAVASNKSEGVELISKSQRSEPVSNGQKKETKLPESDELISKDDDKSNVENPTEIVACSETPPLDQQGASIE